MNPLAADLDHILDNTRDLWEELRGQRLFITGGTGFFGCWLLESFLWANDKLGLNASAVVLTRKPEAFSRKAPNLASHSAIRLHVGDVSSFEFPAGQFSHVIHAATDASAQLIADDPLRMFDTIVRGTHRTLEFACRCSTRKFLLTSSGAVYGRQPPEVTHLPEDYQGAPDPAQAQSAYHEGKRAAETLCAIYWKQRGLETKIARCFAFVGPYLPLEIHFAIGNFIRNGLRGEPIRVKGDGTPYRSYLYAADLAIWIWTILFRAEPCRPYNVGSELALPIAEVARLVAQSFRPSLPVEIHGRSDAGRPPERYVPATRRAQSELSLRERIPLSVAIHRTVQWHRTLAAKC